MSSLTILLSADHTHASCNSSSYRRRSASAVGLLQRLILGAAFLTALYVSTDGRIQFELSRTRTSTSSNKESYPARSVRAVGEWNSSSLVAQTAIEDSTRLNQNATGSAVVPAAAATMTLDREMWCVLDENNTRQFKHFPHASESLLACWSWFQRIRESTAGGAGAPESN
jgi:hypothetical protein